MVPSPPKSRTASTSSCEEGRPMIHAAPDAALNPSRLRGEQPSPKMAAARMGFLILDFRCRFEKFFNRRGRRERRENLYCKMARIAKDDYSMIDTLFIFFPSRTIVS